MRSKPIYLFIVFLLLSTLPLIGSLEESNDRVDWVIDVDADGDAYVTIILQAGEEIRDTWILLPSRENLTLNPEHQACSYTYSRKRWSYFYDNYTFHFTEPITLEISYPFRQASIFEEKRGMFLSPLIMLDRRLRGEIKIVLPNVEEILRKAPPPAQIERRGSIHILSYHIPLNMKLLEYFDRIWILYSLRSNMSLSHLVVGAFESMVSNPYSDEAEDLLKRVGEVNNKISSFFGFNVSNVKFLFYVPEFVQEAGGYVPVKEGIVPDEIHINLLMLRYIPGYLDLVAVHELIHHYVWRAGVDPELRWFHEGAATFLSIQFLLDRKMDGVETYYRDISLASSQFNDVGFILDWSDEYGSASHYAAAFKVFQELNSTLGLDFFKRLFRDIREKGVRISTNEELFQEMSRVSDGASDKVLARLGLRAETIELGSKAYIRPHGYYLDEILKVTAVILAAAITVLMATSILYRREDG